MISSRRLQLSPLAANAIADLAKAELARRHRQRRRREKRASWWMGAKVAMQTRGELEAEVSAPALGSTIYTTMPNRVERRPGNQGGKGVPEWLRTLLDKPGQTTDVLAGTGKT